MKTLMLAVALHPGHAINKEFHASISPTLMFQSDCNLDLRFHRIRSCLHMLEYSGPMVDPFEQIEEKEE